MSWTTIIWSVCAGFSFSVVVIYLLVWLQSPKQLENFIFTVAAFSAAAIALLELLLMHAQTPIEYGQLLRWMHLPAGVIVVSVVWSVHFYVHSGRLWLAWSSSVLRRIILTTNFLMVPLKRTETVVTLASTQMLQVILLANVNNLSNFKITNKWRQEWPIQSGRAILVLHHL